ncbi:hypothetical protein [Litorihabitans aurantiacus]|uniref:Uncharacterized protein n=1 Tax=Litorihabitans aurantiacus TaxID=1930061 RepID=A0AA38CVX4_9MICO|nr:hypothetical protein [Litorihabitans aurantiacus]GMA33100.1 hypothetical protein GCM10025875_30920 [Litorihabitans aurantiacus]
MGRKVNIEPDDIRDQVVEASKQAKALAEQGVEWATPHVEAARDWAAPRIEQAWKSGVKAAGPKVEELAGKASDLTDVAAVKAKSATDSAHDALVDIIIPRVVSAMQEAAKAASDATDTAGKAATKGVDTATEKLAGATDKVAKKVSEQAGKVQPTKSSSGVGRTIGWIVGGAAAAAAGYLVWRRTQPLDDPWAEEYWEDVDGEDTTGGTSSAPAGSADESDESVVEALVDAVATSDEDVEGTSVVEEAEAALKDAAPSSDSSEDKPVNAEGQLGDDTSGAAPKPKPRPRRRAAASGDDASGETDGEVDSREDTTQE